MFSGIGMSSQMITNDLECEEEEKWLPSQLIDFVADQFVDGAFA